MRAYVEGKEMEFATPEELKDFFGLDDVSDDDMINLQAKHICVCPYAEEIHDKRVLMWADTEEQLARDYQDSCDDI